MFFIYSCKDYQVHATAQTPAEVDRILKGPSFHEGYGMFATEDGYGSAIVGTEDIGYTGRQSEMLPVHERNGSVMSGREW